MSSSTGAETPDYSDMSREALERHCARMAQALADDKPRKFWERYAIGPLAAPSCLCCGQLPDKVAIQHMELPGIVVCEKCRLAASQAGTEPPNMLAVCAALGFDPTNHHNAAKCPYCQQGAQAGAEPLPNTDVHLAVPDDEGKEALRKALREAAQSLRTIERLAGRGEYMEDFVQVRGYAGSRAISAEVALAEAQPASASIPPKAAVQDKKDQQGAQAGAEPLRPLTLPPSRVLSYGHIGGKYTELRGWFEEDLAGLRAALAEPQAALK